MSETRISVRVYPNAARNEVIDFADGVLRVRVAAPPVRDKANKELLDFLSHSLGMGKSRLSIVKGHTSHHKIVSINGLSPEETATRLSALVRPKATGL